MTGAEATGVPGEEVLTGSGVEAPGVDGIGVAGTGVAGTGVATTGVATTGVEGTGVAPVGVDPPGAPISPTGKNGVGVMIIVGIAKTGVSVGGTGVEVGTIGVAVGGIGVAVGGTGVEVGTIGVGVGELGVRSTIAVAGAALATWVGNHPQRTTTAATSAKRMDTGEGLIRMLMRGPYRQEYLT